MIGEGVPNAPSFSRFTAEREVGRRSFTTLPGNMLLWSRWFTFKSHSITVLFLLLCSQLVVGGDTTPARGNTTKLACRNISAVDGYMYPMPSYIPSPLLQDEDCEQAWYNEAGEFLSDGHHHANKTRHRLVLHETRKTITVSECIELRLSMSCHGSNQKFKHTYQVINNTTLSFEQQSNSTNTTIISVVAPLILSVLLIVVRYI
ncbi:hypothetical protein AMELA_G00175020 [Ameiurus melas]|uniref:Uncharacterized protein n=1 Tax=Ameiurus melas TaxID=219545 RepID=A0A7J6AFE4_AMEME|nr:hypothetical protein AMELA_G00175020 [Ameiurus melas]